MIACAISSMDSDSIPSSQQELARDYVNQSFKSHKDSDKAGVLVFGTDAGLEFSPNPVVDLQKIQAVVGTERTDIAGATFSANWLSQPGKVFINGAIGDTERNDRVANAMAEFEAYLLEVLGRPLSDTARPRRTDVGSGRFLACRGGFYDPAIFADGREMTVVGRVTGTESRPVGAYNYPSPRVDADVVFLWPEREERDVYYVGALGWHHRPYWAGYYLRPYHPLPRAVIPRKD